MAGADGTPPLGVGIGLRSVHYAHVLSSRPAVPWFEALSENYMGLRGRPAGRPLDILLAVRRDYPVALHGVSLNIGSVDPLDAGYLKRLKDLARAVAPLWLSDHLCWTGVNGENLHDLLPLPYTEEALAHVAARVARAQDFLGRRLTIENVSSYMSYESSAMSEWEFLAALSRRTGCGLLLDVNNIHVSATNHGFDAAAFLEGLPRASVTEMHLAGHSEYDGFLVDTHDHPVTPAVWALYEKALRRFGPVPTLIEWDADIPAFSVLEEEAARARRLQEAACAEPAAR